jgi:hypothetical protein
MKQLVFIHGRSQEDKSPDELKKNWIEAWSKGLDKNNLSMPIAEERIRFPYYGDTLRDMVKGIDEKEAAKIIVRGAEDDAAAAYFFAEMLNDFIAAARISDEEIERNLDPSSRVMIERGPQNWKWVQAVLTTIDQHLPGGAALIALVTNDVYQYLSKSSLRGHIENGVMAAFDKEADNVIVAHSLGSVVAYTVLQRLSQQQGWRVPMMITVGSPLGVKAIRTKLRPISHPSCVGSWFNAMDPDDVVSLYPLDARNFKINPAIENKTDVDNRTPNQHGIIGYLDDPVVARRIYDALQ